MYKKAQAAMEFLMTYGWAILVVLVVIGALAYFGVLNPQNLLPERCELQTGLFCDDYRVTGATGGPIDLVVKNGMGYSIDVVSVSANHSVARTIQCTSTTLTPITNGASASFSLIGANCNLLTYKGGKEKFNIDLVWRKTGATITHTASGNLFARAE